MAQATVDNDTRRRDFLLLTAAACIAAMAARPALARPPGDSALLVLEEQIFEQHNAATALDDEIVRLSDIWQTESQQLWEKSTSGYCALSPQERWDFIAAMPECVEHNSLCRLQDTHFVKMEALVREMWAIPALTPEGRRAKVL